MRTTLLVLAIAAPVAAQVREGPPVKSESEIAALSVAKCADCGPSCPCRACGCESPKTQIARVREDDDPKPDAIIHRYGYFYRLNAAGVYEWCRECNGFAWRPGLPRRDVAYLPQTQAVQAHYGWTAGPIRGACASGGCQ